MALISGRYHLDGSPVDAEQISAMSARGRLFAADRASHHVAGLAGMAARELAPAAPSAAGQRSLVSLDRRRWVVFDGRIDNRRDLAGILRDEHDGDELCDAALVLAAYEAWGSGCAARLIGDFAWVIWDETRERLVGARDILGLRPLFYRHDGRTFAFASQLDQLLASSVSADDLDPRFVADYFVAGASTPERTPIRKISALPPAHSFIVDRKGLRLSRYWELEDRPKIVYRDSREYADHFLELFREGLRAHLRSDGPVWSDLSGGLDSSSIVSLAAQELGRSSGGLCDSFATLSIVFDRARESDESSWSKAVAETLDLAHHRISGDDHTLESAVEGAAYWDVPCLEFLSYSLHRKIVRTMQEHGAGVLLKGLGAELVVLGEAVPPVHLADRLRGLELGRFARELLAWQSHLKEPLIQVLYRFALRPLLFPKTVTVRSFGGVPHWVSPGFARRMDLERRGDRAWFGRRFRSVADQWQYEQICRLPGALYAGCFHKALDIRLPFLSRPLIELSMALPWESKVRLGIDKPLLRDAMRGILPERVRQRKQLVTGTPAFDQAMRRSRGMIERLIATSRLAEMGFIDGDALAREARLARHGACKFLPGLLRPIALELWLRARLADRPSLSSLPIPLELAHA